MRIQIVTPASRSSRKGNWTTAARWARVCRDLGHHVDVAQSYRAEACDLLIALHARKSAKAIRKACLASCKSVLMLTGTDIYNPYDKGDVVWNSMKAATRLVVLQSEAITALPAAFRSKVNVIYQSAVATKSKPTPLKSVFEIGIVGHLRPVKDPFRAAIAARQLPEESRIRIYHLGAALSDSMRRSAETHSSKFG